MYNFAVKEKKTGSEHVNEHKIKSCFSNVFISYESYQSSYPKYWLIHRISSHFESTILVIVSNHGRIMLLYYTVLEPNNYAFWGRIR